MSRAKLRYERDPRGQDYRERLTVQLKQKGRHKKNQQFELLHSLNTSGLTGGNAEVFPQNVFLLAEARKTGRSDVRLDE